MTQGERVKAIRSYSGLSMEKFGERIGMVKSSISNIENNNRALSDQLAKLMAKEFNVSEHWLRTGEGEMFVQLSGEEELKQWADKMLSGQAGEFRQRFVRLLAKLNDDQWEQLEKYARMLVDSDDPTPDEKDESIIPIAAHADSSMEQTEEGKAYDDAIMRDDNEWN